MKRLYLISAISLLISPLYASGADFPYQQASYKIDWECAFIHGTAAHATIGYSCEGGIFNATLQGSSVPIFDTIFSVDDTVTARFVPSSNPVAPPAEYISYINGYYRKPHPGKPFDPNLPQNYRDILGQGTLSADASTMEAVNLTADMLSLFYYAKTFDFGSMPQGVPQYVDVVMPDYSRRTLQLTYEGSCDYGGNQAYRLIANFTYDGRFSAYPITVIIDPSIGLPVEFAADIAIGRVVMTYNY